jgi:glycosidase
MNKFKMGIAMLMTLRGIPSIYYGTELAQNNVMPRTNDGQIRLDFEGGWPSDKINKFTQDGRTSKENEAFDFIKKMANWRKGNKVFSKGKTMQYTPIGSTYVYFRYTEDSCVMVAVNRGKMEVTLEGDRYKERLNGYSSGIDIMNEEPVENLQSIKLAPNSIKVIELRK